MLSDIMCVCERERERLRACVLLVIRQTLKMKCSLCCAKRHVCNMHSDGRATLLGLGTTSSKRPCNCTGQVDPHPPTRHPRSLGRPHTHTHTHTTTHTHTRPCNCTGQVGPYPPPPFSRPAHTHLYLYIYIWDKIYKM